MSNFNAILNISTHLDHIAHPLTKEKGTNKPSLDKRIAGIVAFIFISLLTLGIASIFYVYKAKLKCEKLSQNESMPNTRGENPTVTQEPPNDKSINTAKALDPESSYPKLVFDEPMICSLEQCKQLRVIKRKMNEKMYSSDIPEYQDSKFEVTAINDDEFILIRRSSVKVYLPTKRELKVSELAPNKQTLEKISQLVGEWVEIAEDKMHESSETYRSNELISDSYNLCRGVGQCMDNPEKTQWMWNRILICEDIALKEIQSIALLYYTESRITLSHLVTHPRNVRCPVNSEETTRVEGAGSKLINHMKISLLPDCVEIYLEATKSARLFYEKLGFIELNQKEHPPRERGTIPMSYSVTV